ncbi:CocE/NonD family hydrolase [Falsiroseomonas ponticola]|uniref:CocE/NonD family hydrolase n=1 Tax=Falsiroseomonas ponticola TaxID=2786951 RepID=UPI001932D0E5|nr:CocE/NonD family hydrolase [Roseomonas ponticola]
MTMIVERDVAIPMADGVVLRANVFRPEGPGPFPVIMSMGIYGKDIHFADGYTPQWAVLTKLYPGLATDGSTGRWLRWEVPDPERFVPDGFALVNVDSRGSGKSPGYLDPFSPRETQDYAEAIDWAGTQPWSNGKVGLLGVSYLAIKQWQVAALRPKHLAAIVPWEGATDLYRDWSHHGGILSNSFTEAWWPRQALVNQHGSAETPHRDRETGERTTGPAAFSADILKGSRSEHPQQIAEHPLDDGWMRERTPDLSRITVPVLSAGNWGGPGLHLRGNTLGFERAGTPDKWLSMHDGTHYESFYLPDYVAMQKRFLGHFLRGDANGWESEPRVQLSIRHPGRPSLRRMEREWPLARTHWTKLYLGDRSLGWTAPGDDAVLDYDAFGEGIDFTTAPFDTAMEFTGPLALRLWVASSTVDMDVFATLRCFAPDGQEVVFTGAHEPVPVARGWLRASHRALDEARSTPWRPWHPHDRVEPLEPGTFVKLDIEIWPTCLVVPLGHRLVLTVAGRDFEYPGRPGRILHNHQRDRDATIFGGRNSIATGGARESFLLMPLIPER